MKQIWTVFRFEFGNYMRGKAYRILTLLFVALIIAGMSYPRFAEMFKGKEPSADAGAGQTVQAEQTESEHIAVACAPGELTAEAMAADMTAQLPLYTWTAVAMDEAALTEAVRTGEYTAGLWMQDALTYRHIVQNNSMHDMSGYMIDDAIGNAYRVRTLAGLGVPMGESISVIMARAQGETIALQKEGLVTYIYAYALVMLLYMSVMLYGQFVSGSVASEKSNRAMELLITNARPTNLMFGKVLGTGLAGLLQMASFVVAAFVGYRLNLAYWGDNAIMSAVFSMPTSVLVYALVFFLLGFFLYACLYGALGSLVSRSEDVASVTMPVTMLFVFAFMVVMFSAGADAVDNVLMRVTSLVPFTSPMSMFVRICMGAPAPWEIALSILLLAATTVAMGILAAGIYRVGVLLYGKPPKIKELMRAVKAAREAR